MAEAAVWIGGDGAFCEVTGTADEIKKFLRTRLYDRVCFLRHIFLPERADQRDGRNHPILFQLPAKTVKRN